jgi:cytochrome c-type biogenesis protein CcmH/NrfF
MRPEVALRTLALAAALLMPIGALGAADLSDQQRIESRLMCYCGCADLTVRVCTCGTAAGMRQEIAGRLGRGETVDQVLAAFVARHGEQILAAPTMAGFNLLAWITPFAAILAAGAVLVVLARRWTASGAAAAATSPPGTRQGELTSRQREAFDRVEREFREGH